MKTERRIDPKKIEEIQKIIKRCREGGFSKFETIFLEYKVSKATLHEHAAANNPLYLKYNSKTKKYTIDSDILKSYLSSLSEYNHSEINPDEKVIGVSYTYQDLEGKQRKIFYREISNNENVVKARQMEACDQRIKGDLKRKAELKAIVDDKDLKRRQDNKLRVLQRRLNKDKK
ncbi:MAG: hypothetical protein ACXWE7_12055 [Nitrososphaeraceae archaeon]